MQKLLFGLLLLCAVTSCTNSSTKENGSSDSTTSVSGLYDENRADVKKEAIASYDIPLKNNLNNWHFTVQLFETKKRFNYLLNMQYQEVSASDTIRFPNFGINPEPQIRKGSTDEECIIGFLDKEKKFREYIKVFVDNEQLRVKTLKQYAVTQK